MHEAILKSPDRRIWNTVNKFRLLIRQVELGLKANWIEIIKEYGDLKAIISGALRGLGELFSLAFLFYRRLSPSDKWLLYFTIQID